MLTIAALVLAILLPLCAGAQTPDRDPDETARPPQEGLVAPLPRDEYVVTPCRGCRISVLNSPAAVSVISPETIEVASDPRLPELLRGVPGVNLVETSAREHDMTSRQATSTLAPTQLVLVDGRSVYQDFLGVILWDMVRVDPLDVEQIEVVRGPASAVWGANAFTGVVNVLTRSPLESERAALTLQASSFSRDAGSLAGQGAGLSYLGSTTISRRVNEGFAYRVSGGYGATDPRSRPVGVLPLVPHPLAPDTLVGGGKLPEDASEPGSFRNRGSTQPWVDLRLDQRLAGGVMSYSAGVAGSDGVVHTGIGPFNIQRGAEQAYGRAAWSRDLLRLSLSVSQFGATAPSLLALDADREPVRLEVDTRSFDLDASHTRQLGQRSVLTYGANLRRSSFDISLAPGAPDRTEAGAYLQEELFLDWGPLARRRELRLVIGARLDHFDNIQGLVLSPRFSVVLKPSPNHALRFSANKAFRAPSVVNNYLDQTTLTPVDLEELVGEVPPGVDPLYLLPQRATGSPDLDEESLTSWEIGYIGTIEGRTTLGLNLYLNDTRDNINFTRLPDDLDPYTAEDPPLDWPLSPDVLTELAARGVYLSRNSTRFLNLGPIRHRGVELFAEHRFSEGVTGVLSYSWQPEPRVLPDPDPFPAAEISLPPRNRVFAALRWSGTRLLGSLSLHHADQAFWTDVLPHDFDGFSDPYTMFNASFGVRWGDGRILTLVRGTNLTNAVVRQHVYGDILRRSVTAELRFMF